MRFTLFFAVGLLAGCGGLADADGIPNVRTLGRDGGTVTSEDGRFVLEVPAGALDGETTIVIEQRALELPQLVGQLYEIDPPLALRKPATVRLRPEASAAEGWAIGPGLYELVQEDGVPTWIPVDGAEQDGDVLVGPLPALGAYCAWLSCASNDQCADGFRCSAGGACVPKDPGCGAVELCGDGVDNDCDPSTVEEPCACEPGYEDCGGECCFLGYCDRSSADPVCLPRP